MLSYDFVESGQDGRNGVVRRVVVLLLVSGRRKFLNKISHGIFALRKIKISQVVFCDYLEMRNRFEVYQ